jgi:uncharacterized protein (DUF1697 family)
MLYKGDRQFWDSLTKRALGFKMPLPKRRIQIVGDTQIALLRGINVGRAERVAMADLRALIEQLGYEDVRTLRNSGNVVLGRIAPDETAARIAEALMERLGVSSRVTVLAADELAEVVRENPVSRPSPDSWLPETAAS